MLNLREPEAMARPPALDEQGAARLVGRSRTANPYVSGSIEASGSEQIRRLM